MIIRVYTTVSTDEDVAKGLSGEDVREDLHPFDSTDEAVAWLLREGFTYPSDEPVASAHTWLYDATYLHPYTNDRTERTAHPADGTITDAEWLHIVRTVTA